MVDYRNLAHQQAERVAAVASALHATAGTFAACAAAGAAAGAAGMVLAGAHLAVGLLVGLVLGLPIVGLWRLRAALALVSSLPSRLRPLPEPLERGLNDLSDVSADMARIKTNPKTPRAYANTLRRTVQAYQRLEGLRSTSLLSAGLTLHPATLMAGAVSALWAVGSTILGLAILSLALLLR